MRKTLLLTHEYYPYHGGIARYCYELFSRFPAARYRVLTDQKEPASPAPVLNRRLLSSFMRPSWLKGIGVVQKVMDEFGGEVIVTPHLLPLGNIAQALKWKRKIPYVISLHGLDINLALANKRKMALGILSDASHIIVNSSATATLLVELKLKTPVTVITPCLSSDRLIPAEQVRGRIARHYSGKKLILTVGRLVKRKGQDSVLRALPAIVKTLPTAYYCIIGDGPDKGYLEALIRELKLGAYAEIRTNVTEAELGAYYEAASVFAMPTRSIGPDIEGFGMVYLEAAFFSKPIVAGESGGEREALNGDQNALFVDGNNLAELSEALREIMLDNELAAFIGANARKHVDSLPTWDAQARKLETIIDAL